MTVLSDLFDPDLFSEMLYNGYVRRQVHPSAPLSILNYADKTAYERQWNPVTRQCRGLIYNHETQEVAARPFPKFFNYGEPGSPDGLAGRDEPVCVTDKLDGSLGIMYYDPSASQFAVATRGSFTSDQAQHATDVLRRRYRSWIPDWSMVTYLWEILYPANRIVLDYGSTDDLVLLGAVNIRTGRSFTAREAAGRWPGPVAEEMPARTFREALELKPRPDAEGVVVHFLHRDERVKIKQDDYVQLHRLVFGMNARVVWERIGAGETTADICKGIPEEFHEWVTATADDLLGRLEEAYFGARREYIRIVNRLATGWTRKEFAAEAVKSPYRSWLFMIHDGQDCTQAIWKTLRPSAERAMIHRSEDAA